MIRWMYAFIDCARERFGVGAEFWTAVTGTHLSVPRGERNEFATLLPEDGELDPYLKVQTVGDAGGVHLDFSTQDVPAFARAATDLGATVVADHGGYVVLRSPGGLLFCSVDWHGESRYPGPIAGSHGGRTRVDQVCIDTAAAHYEPEVAFWTGLTGWRLTPSTLPEFLRLEPPAGMPVRFLLQRLSTGNLTAAQRPTSAHLDLACDDRDAAAAEHERLGAVVVARRSRWTVMRDPAGREYCLTGRRP